MSDKGKKEKGRGPLVSNRQARRDYHIEDTFEAGLVLVGTEVKSLRAGRGSLQDAYVEIRDGEAWLINSHIHEYGHASSVFNHEPRRARRLLMHKHEIERLAFKVQQKGFTLIPLAIFPKGRWLKVEVAYARGKKLYDKRDDIKDRDVKRDMERTIRDRNA